MPIVGSDIVMPEPQVIYQEWLDITSDALQRGNAEEFARHIYLPFVMRTVAGETVLETRDDLLADIANVIEALRAQNVTNYVRLVKQARYVHEDVIEGWHTTHVLRNAMNVVAPYGNRMMMRRIDGIWKVSEADHELDGDRIPMMLLRSQPGAMSDVWSAATSEIRASYAKAEPIYQIFLDSLCRTTLEHDFAGWCEHFTMPHEIHYDTTDHLVEDPDEIRPFFDLLSETMDTLGADSFERRAKHAEFLSGDRILGYHDAVFRRNGATVMGPVNSRMTLSQQDGRWVCSSVTNSLSNDRVPRTRFKVSDGLPTLRQIQERMKK